MAGIDKRAVLELALGLLERELESLRESADKTRRAATLSRHPLTLRGGR